MENFSIRIAEEKDAKEIHDIYDYYVKNTAVTFSTENPTVEEYKKQISETKKIILILSHKIQMEKFWDLSTDIS